MRRQSLLTRICYVTSWVVVKLPKKMIVLDHLSLTYAAGDNEHAV